MPEGGLAKKGGGSGGGGGGEGGGGGGQEVLTFQFKTFASPPSGINNDQSLTTPLLAKGPIVYNHSISFGVVVVSVHCPTS